MSKKTFQAVARVIHSARISKPMPDEKAASIARNGALAEVTLGLCEVFAAGNERFDRQRFIEACETGKTKGMPR